MRKLNNTGFTLIELLITVAIIAILAVLAAPSFQDTLRAQRVEGAAEALLAALNNAKAEALKTNSAMRIVFTPTGINTDHTTWCYGMTQVGTTTCVCTTDADATNDCATGSVVQSTDYANVSVNFNDSNSRVFNPLRGTSANATVLFSGGNNKTLGVITTMMGRNRICKPAGSTITGYSNNGAC
jgi:prepilin-type N-terminal cleavage/methylation domain-containing protein